jgi:hypothetical protein
MFENIILPILTITGSLITFKILYKATGGFMKEESGYSNMKSFGVWIMGLIFLIAGVIFLIKGIIKMFFS